MGSLDEAQRAKGAIGLEVQFLVPAGDAEALPSLAALVQPDAFAASETPPPTPKPTPKPTPRPTPRPTSASTGPYRQVLSGTATWYYGTTTAMRLPHGTKVRICGSSACIERTITDYGPAAWTGNLIDLMPADFRTVCGCGTGTGKVRVTVYVY